MSRITYKNGWMSFASIKKEYKTIKLAITLLLLALWQLPDGFAKLAETAKAAV